MNIKAPWLRHYGEVPKSIAYPPGTMFDAVAESAAKYPASPAFSFMGAHTSYGALVEQVHKVARAFAAAGVKQGDKVTLCLPNLPQTVLCFYALNVIGAIANMIHPLSGEGEIIFYLKDSESVAVVTLDQFYGKFASIRKQHPVGKLIITSVADALSTVKRLGYKLTEGRKIAPIPKQADVLRWGDFLERGESYTKPYVAQQVATDPAVILYSGGTTGTTKGILLSNLNFNALALQTATMANCVVVGNSMLSVMPMFHGFGLGVGIHTMLVAGCRCILVPRFNPASYAELLRKERPNYIAGVPTLYEALLRTPDVELLDLSCLKGVFSGGDSLSVELKKKFDRFLKEHKATVEIREGYGTTECVTASCLTPYHMAREGSIGLPFPDTFYKIVAVGTTRELPFGEEGEICISGPSVMLGYVNQPEESAQVLQTHADGRVWMHSGDLGVMDADGFIYFRQRIKRMIVSSGYSIYPSQLENVLDAHEAVLLSCCIGIPDPLKVQHVKAFIVLKQGIQENREVMASIWTHCQRNIAKYALPYDIEVRQDLPKTLVGKVAYKVLEAEEALKREQAEEAFRPEEVAMQSAKA